MKLTSLATVCRQAGLTTIEEEGLDKVSGRFIPWTKFGRSGNSGYSASGPTHVMVHHTASSASIQNDVRYCQVSSSIRPLTNLIVARDGNVHVCAAGPSNTNGSGKDTWGGGTPDNGMNARAIGIELCNNGIGEPYPEAQQNAVVTLAAALCKAYDIPVNQVRGHFEWSPTRKIDPTGPSRWSGNQTRKWDMDAFRVSVQARLDNTEQEDDDMPIGFIWTHEDSDKPGAYWVCNGGVAHLDAAMRDILKAQGTPHINSGNDDVWESYRRVAQGLG